MEKRKKLRSKKAFTLLELMICLAILGLVSVIMGVKGRDLLSYHQFRISSQLFLKDLGRWQIVSMATGSDVSCSIQKTPKGYQVLWESDSPSLKKEGYALDGVEELSALGKQVVDLKFTVYSSGRISFNDFLVFTSKAKRETLYLDLSYPFSLQQKKGQLSFQKSPLPPYPEIKKEKPSYSLGS